MPNYPRRLIFLAFWRSLALLLTLPSVSRISCTSNLAWDELNRMYITITSHVAVEYNFHCRLPKLEIFERLPFSSSKAVGSMQCNDPFLVTSAESAGLRASSMSEKVVAESAWVCHCPCCRIIALCSLSYMY
jgi:hypothetical protein